MKGWKLVEVKAELQFFLLRWSGNQYYGFSGSTSGKESFYIQVTVFCRLEVESSATVIPCLRYFAAYLLTENSTTHVVSVANSLVLPMSCNVLLTSITVDIKKRMERVTMHNNSNNLF
jgi:hypothetical protein